MSDTRYHIMLVFTASLRSRVWCKVRAQNDVESPCLFLPICLMRKILGFYVISVPCWGNGLSAININSLLIWILLINSTPSLHLHYSVSSYLRPKRQIFPLTTSIFHPRTIPHCRWLIPSCDMDIRKH